MDKDEIFQIIENSNEFPEIPKNIGEILNLLKSPEELDIDELIKKVTLNDELHNTIMSFVNNNHFLHKRNIKNIKEATVFLGMNSVKNLIISFIVRKLFSKSKSRTKVFNREKYSKHSLGTAIASSMIAEKTGLSKKFDLFTYGLLHDMGIAVLDLCMPDILDKVVNLQLKGMKQIAAERYVMGGLTHSDIGVWLCDKWGLPKDIRNIVEFHHKPLLAEENEIEIKLLFLGDNISNYYYEKLLGLNVIQTFNKLLLESIGLTEDELESISKELPLSLDNLRREFKHLIF